MGHHRDLGVSFFRATTQPRTTPLTRGMCPSFLVSGTRIAAHGERILRTVERRFLQDQKPPAADADPEERFP